MNGGRREQQLNRIANNLDQASAVRQKTFKENYGPHPSAGGVSLIRKRRSISGKSDQFNAVVIRPSLDARGE